VGSSLHIDCVCGHFDYTCGAIQLQFGVAKVKDTDKFDRGLRCHLVVSVSTLPQAPSPSLLACVCFSLVFNTVLEAFFKSFLIDSGYETPIQNMDEMFASGIKLTYPRKYNFIFENVDEIGL